MGTSNQKYATAVIIATSIKPIRTKGIVLPRMNSAFVMGVAMICSMVPISFSRTTAILDRSMVIMRTMLAMTAGT